MVPYESKAGDRVAPPPGTGEYEIRFDTSEAAKGWEELCRQAPGNTLRAWHMMRIDPCPAVCSPRHHPLKGKFAVCIRGGCELTQWQIEVTGAGRIWYVLDDRTVWVRQAQVGHPRQTD